MFFFFFQIFGQYNLKTTALKTLKSHIFLFSNSRKHHPKFKKIHKGKVRNAKNLDPLAWTDPVPTAFSTSRAAPV